MKNKQESEPYDLYFNKLPNEKPTNSRTKVQQTAERKTNKLPNSPLPAAQKFDRIPVMDTYKSRIIDETIARKLRGVGAVVVKGAKWCGKTTTCEQHAKSVIYIEDPLKRQANIEMADININQLIDGDYPRLLDEWQEIPKLWDAVRFRVDHSSQFGLYLLTGSAVPPDTDEIKHSGTGRFARLTMRPMTLWESDESSGELSLHDLFDEKPFESCRAKSKTLDEIAYIVSRGGWPASVRQDRDTSLERAYEYVDSVAETDISRSDNKKRSPTRTRRLMKSYARLQGTQSNLTAIRGDMLANDSSTLSEDTIASYLDALRRIYVIEDMEAWSPNLRSKTPIRTSDTRYFTDPSLAVASLGAGPGNLIRDIKTFGLIFETMAVRDLRVYAESFLGGVSHYLDASGLECDAIIHLRDGRYGLVEIKLGGDALIQKGIDSLTDLESKLNLKMMGKPSFKMVLTAVGDFAYRRREDGIIICPITALKN